MIKGKEDKGKKGMEVASQRNVLLKVPPEIPGKFLFIFRLDIDIHKLLLVPVSSYSSPDF